VEWESELGRDEVGEGALDDAGWDGGGHALFALVRVLAREQTQLKLYRVRTARAVWSKGARRDDRDEEEERVTIARSGRAYSWTSLLARTLSS